MQFSWTRKGKIEKSKSVNIFLHLLLTEENSDRDEIDSTDMERVTLTWVSVKMGLIN